MITITLSRYLYNILVQIVDSAIYSCADGDSCSKCNVFKYCNFIKIKEQLKNI